MPPDPSLPNPYAPPQAPYGPAPPWQPGYAESPPRVDGPLVTIAKTYALPPLCVKCGTRDDLRTRAQPFAWFPAWTYFLLLLGVLPLIIVQMVMTKRANLRLPVCAACHSRWTKARVLRSLAFIIPIVLGLGLLFMGIANQQGVVALIGFLLIFPGILAVIPVDLLLVRPRILRAVFIDDRVVTLKGVAPQVLDVLRGG
jgi:hypothetical protein